MSTDADEIRAAARVVSGLAARARTASVAVTGSGHARWESLGAQRFRAQLGRQHDAFQGCACALDELGTLLLSHARHVESHEAALAKAALAVVDTAHTVEDDACTAVRDVTRMGNDVHHLWDETGATVLRAARRPW